MASKYDDGVRVTCTCGDVNRTYIDPLPDDKILDWSNLKQIADDNLKCI